MSKSFLRTIIDEVVLLLTGKDIDQIVQLLAERGTKAAVDFVIDAIPLPLPKSIKRSLSKIVVDEILRFIKQNRVAPNKNTLHEFVLMKGRGRELR